jgi:cbb3-type cytochrome oxidase subunit 3
VYDIKNVSETGKIIAFILLGVLILVISFVYQKIRKLVVDEASDKKNEDEKI